MSQYDQFPKPEEMPKPDYEFFYESRQIHRQAITMRLGQEVTIKISLLIKDRDSESTVNLVPKENDIVAIEEKELGKGTVGPLPVVSKILVIKALKYGTLEIKAGEGKNNVFPKTELAKFITLQISVR